MLEIGFSSRELLMSTPGDTPGRGKLKRFRVSRDTVPETVKLLKSSPPSSTDILHLAWILCALRRPAELTTLSSLAQNTLTDPEFVLYFIRYLRVANPRFDADHPFSARARFLAAATGEADTLSDCRTGLADRLVSKVSSRMDTLDPSTLACLAALTEATGINAPQVVDKAMKVDLTSWPEGTLVALNKAVFRSGYKGGKMICESALVALPGMTFDELLTLAAVVVAKNFPGRPIRQGSQGMLGITLGEDTS
ncbi:hypothetical protein FOZ62_022196 [Perkinsus olseni]|uniref:Uncharacterized protein n=1 Tax=Perkinsus olseni TaxID=32597 RepID=A0A7J6QUL2_PEROL|nr:hypothetical protein FOZ62_022196 [Perkinsus olseni]